MFKHEIQTTVTCSMSTKLIISVKLDLAMTDVKSLKKNNDTFLYQFFKRNGHSPDNVTVQ